MIVYHCLPKMSKTVAAHTINSHWCHNHILNIKYVLISQSDEICPIVQCFHFQVDREIAGNLQLLYLVRTVFVFV